MAGRAVEIALFLLRVRLVLRAHGIVRTELAELDRRSQVSVHAIGGFDQAAERALGVRTRRVEQNAVARAQRVDPLANRARRVSAIQRDTT